MNDIERLIKLWSYHWGHLYVKDPQLFGAENQREY